MKKAILANIVAVSALLGAGLSPALASSSSSHWSSAKCTAYAKKYASATKTQKSAANRTLKAHSCTNRVK